MYEFVAVVRLPNGLTQRVTIRADDGGRARAMLEAQFGRVRADARLPAAVVKGTA